MTRTDRAIVAFVFALIRTARHRQTLIKLAMGADVTPTRWRASSRNGGALGRGMAYPPSRFPRQHFVPRQVPQWPLPLGTTQNHFP